MIKYSGILLVSKDLEATKTFYKNLFNARVTIDFGSNITLTGGISFQSLDSWAEFIHQPKETIHFQGNNAEIYYETDDLDTFIETLKLYDVDYVHPLQTHEWGQRGIRVYDPDKHIIEISESLSTMVKRFVRDGMSLEEIAEKTMLSLNMIERFLKKA